MRDARCVLVQLLFRRPEHILGEQTARLSDSLNKLFNSPLLLYITI